MSHRKTYANINFNHLSYNLKEIYNTSKKSLFCVVKANAYGHGIVEISKFLETQPNVEYLCVSSIDEALLLRRSLIKCPIINLGYTDIEDVDVCIKNDITISLPSLEWFNSLCKLSINHSSLKIHIKIDTGMNRLGIKNVEDYKTVIEYAKKNNILFEGIFSHYYSSDDINKSASDYQLNLFKEILYSTPYDYTWIHIANSEAIIDMKESVTNAIRCGLSMYGYSSKTTIYKPILSLYTHVTQIKNVNKNEIISYSATHVIDDEKRIAILPIGYADGFNRKLQNSVLYINNQPVKILGRICMDQTIIEYPLNIDQMDVEIIGENQSANDLAKYLDTIPYEVLSTLSYRITRNYYYNDKLVSSMSISD